MTGYIEYFLAEKDRNGLPLYRDAKIVGRVAHLAVIEWHGPDRNTDRRTLVCDVTGHAYAGVLGDSDHVERWLRKLLGHHGAWNTAL